MENKRIEIFMQITWIAWQTTKNSPSLFAQHATKFFELKRFRLNIKFDLSLFPFELQISALDLLFMKWCLNFLGSRARRVKFFIVRFQALLCFFQGKSLFEHWVIFLKIMKNRLIFSKQKDYSVDFYKPLSYQPTSISS